MKSLIVTSLTAIVCLSSIASTYARVPTLTLVGDKPIKPLTHRNAQNTISYCTGFEYDDYASEINAHYGSPSQSLRWGRHPILWKHMIHPEYDFNPNAFEGTPNGMEIAVGDSVLLNNYEASGAFSYEVTDEPGGGFDGTGPVDPAGTWVETIIQDATTTAIYAAMSIWKYNTPVYINYSADLGSLIGVIDCVTLSADAAPPHLACDWIGNDVSVGTAESCNNLVVESVKMSYFTDVTLCIDCNGPGYIGGPNEFVVDAQAFELGYSYPPSYEDSKVVIMDPPVNAEVDVNAMVTASQRQANKSMLRTSSDLKVAPRIIK